MPVNSKDDQLETDRWGCPYEAYGASTDVRQTVQGRQMRSVGQPNCCLSLSCDEYVPVEIRLFWANDGRKREYVCRRRSTRDDEGWLEWITVREVVVLTHRTIKKLNCRRLRGSSAFQRMTSTCADACSLYVIVVVVVVAYLLVVATVVVVLLSLLSSHSNLISSQRHDIISSPVGISDYPRYRIT